MPQNWQITSFANRLISPLSQGTQQLGPIHGRGRFRSPGSGVGDAVRLGGVVTWDGAETPSEDPVNGSYCEKGRKTTKKPYQNHIYKTL